jgi:hypothetical protein
MRVGSNGLITSKAVPGYDPSLPFGRYTITVSVPGTTKTVTLNNWLAAGAPCGVMELSAGSSTGGAACP